MKRFSSSTAAVAVLLVLVVGCGGGSDGPGETDTGGACSPAGGDPDFFGRWTFDVGVHPIDEITFNTDGTFSGVLSGGCQVSGTWKATSGILNLCVGTTSPICEPEEVAPGDVGTFSYTFSPGGDYVTIADEDGTTDLERD